MSYIETYRYTLDDFNFLMHIINGYLIPEDNPALYNRKYDVSSIKKEVDYILKTAIYENDKNDILINWFPKDYIMIEILFELAFYNNGINDLSKILEAPTSSEDSLDFQTMPFLDDIDYAEIVFNKTIKEKNDEIEQYNATVNIVERYLQEHPTNVMKDVTNGTGVAYPLVREIMNSNLEQKQNVNYGTFDEVLSR